MLRREVKMSAWIVTIGDELLIGKVLNWNAYWIAKRLSSIGIDVLRILCIPDDKAEIKNAIRDALASNVRYVFTTGGLGPTPGDITLEAISEVTQRTLELNDIAKMYVEKRYKELYELGLVDSPELNESRLKMAKIPRGAEVIYNDIGVAPGVILKLLPEECKEISEGKRNSNEECYIISLPGVPSEAMYIFEKIVVKMRGYKKWLVEDYIDIMDESVIADILEDVRKKYPQVNIKTYPIGFGQQRMKVIVIAQSKERAIEVLNEFKNAIKSKIGYA